MKTIEEKAKAYDEALERARKYMAKGYDVLMPEIFPDLKESEDERIREFLIMIVKNLCKLNFVEVTKSDVLAWLEKQKEPENVSASTMAPSCWQKEQKPAEKQDYSGLTDFERAIHRGFLCAGVVNVPVTIIKETAQDCLAHLPAEWSEEDEKVYSRLLNQYENLTHCITTADRHQEIREELNFLKSLRPSWKPSEEQMAVLLNAEGLVRANNYKENAKILAGLYEELKKLM